MHDDDIGWLGFANPFNIMVNKNLIIAIEELKPHKEPNGQKEKSVRRSK